MALNKHPLLVLAIAFAAGIILSTLLNTPGPVSYTHLTLPTICSV